jgi:hypothetical protein
VKSVLESRGGHRQRRLRRTALDLAQELVRVNSVR